MGKEKDNKAPSIEVVDQALEQHVRPLLQADGGDVQLERIRDDGSVFLCFRGRCAGCPGLEYTLSSLVEPMLVAKVPGVTRVIPVTWHLPDG